MNNNDFSEVLRDFINTLNLPLTCTLDYLSEKESLVIYPLPGGKIEKEYMNGKQDISLVKSSVSPLYHNWWGIGMVWTKNLAPQDARSVYSNTN